MNMKNSPTSAEINSLFANSDPEMVWVKASGIISRISPGYDFTVARSIFDDVLRLFHGEYTGYGPIKTLYHDLRHTLDVFLCSARLMHGVHLSGNRLTDDEMTLVMVATLLHDIGYAQPQDEQSGTGAQHTQTHVRRGIAFMQRYLAERQLLRGFAVALEPMMLCTDPALTISQIELPDDRTRMLGQIVGTADLTGQMADRTYLEKLLFLYLEFKEAHFGNYQNTYDLLCQTKRFYEIIRERLDIAFDGMYAMLTFHFEDTMGAGKNFYLEAIEKNIAYLSQVIKLNEEEYLSMLKRGGIVERSMALDVQG